MLAHAALIALAVLAKSPAPADDVALWKGKWTLTHQELDGMMAPPEAIKDAVMVVEGDKYDQQQGGMHMESGTFKLDPAKTPKTVDLTVADGPEKGQVLLGIYELQGDTLKICISAPGSKDRPTDFTTKAGSNRMLTVLQRAK